MHRLNSTWGRSLPAIAIALAAAAVLAAVIAVNLGSGTSPVSATNPTVTPTGTLPPGYNVLWKFGGISCADIYLEQAPQNNVGSPPGPEDLPVASALTRTEPSATAGMLDITTVTYQGPDLVTGDENFILDAVPDTGPTVDTCAVARTNGQNGPEQEKMHQRTAFASQFGTRPVSRANIIVGTYDATNSEDGAGANTCGDAIDNGPDGLVDSGDPDCYDAGTTTYIHFSTCGFSESLGVWERTESTNAITDKSANAINYGRVTLFVAAGIPTSGTLGDNQNVAVDPTTCAIAGSFPFASVTAVYARTATTDKPTQGNNAAAIAAGRLSVDQDGCNPNAGHQKPTPTPTSAPCDPKPKAGQDLDGSRESPPVADDWDGDGCPDWDELDHAFNHSFTTPNSTNQNGMDPYNPNDCDKLFTNDFSLFVTAAHDTATCSFAQLITEGSAIGACGPGLAIENGAQCNPGDAVDDDRDGTVNDGCPAVGPSETGAGSSTGTATAATTGPPGTMTDTGVVWVVNGLVGSTVTAGGKTLIVASNTATVITGTAGWSGGGNPGAVAYTLTNSQCANNKDDDGDGFVNDGCPGITPNGQFFQCLANVIQTVSGGNTDPVTFVAGCYSDSTVQVVNAAYFAETGGACTDTMDNDSDGFINDGCPKVGATSEGDIPGACASGNAVNDDGGDDSVVNDGCPGKPDSCPAAPATQDNCGDGRAGPRPPGGATRNSGQAFLNIDDQSFPVSFSGTYNHTTNRLTFDICLQNGGPFFGPIVAANGNIDAHTGAGTMDLHGTLQTMADCLDGMPYTTQVSTALDIIGAEVELTERGPNIDSDHDGCIDNAELGASLGAGGKRDPFNKWDYFNPALNNANNSADITAVVTHYGHPPGDPMYKERYDRGPAVPGSHFWNFRPPNGNISSGDITAAVNSYGHNCPAKLPPPYTS